MIKIFEVPAGKWRINVAAEGAARHMAGYDVDKIELQGLRDKTFALFRMSRDDFNAVAPFGDNGEPLKPALHLHGTPVGYFHQPRVRNGGNSNRFAGYMIYLWPAPLTKWKLKVTYVKTELTRNDRGWLEAVRVE